jgi:hypothetical protein
MEGRGDPEAPPVSERTDGGLKELSSCAEHTSDSQRSLTPRVLRTDLQTAFSVPHISIIVIYHPDHPGFTVLSLSLF